jgi:predicted nucleic acid-binding protein
VKLIYLDTSAYLKEFAREQGSDAIARLFESCEKGEIRLIISEWAINEGIAAIDRKLRRGEITIAERDGIIREVLRATRNLALTATLPWCRWKALVSSSARLITKRHLSADDSLQLFSALVAEAEVFISADSRLNEAASSEGIRSFDIERAGDAKELLSDLGFGRQRRPWRSASDPNFALRATSSAVCYL